MTLVASHGDWQIFTTYNGVWVARHPTRHSHAAATLAALIEALR